MNNKPFSDTAFQVLLLTVVSIAGVHYYEIGFCRYFKIPTEFISFELNKYSLLLFTFIATLFIVAMVVDGIVGHFMTFVKIKKKLIRILILVLFLAAISFSLMSFLKFLKNQEIIIFIAVILFGIMLIINKDNPDNTYEVIHPKYSINLFLSRRFGTIIGPVLIASSITCTLLFCLGYNNAENQKKFSVRPDNKTVLLKKYGTNTIYGILESGKVIQIVVEENIAKTDTFHIIKIN